MNLRENDEQRQPSTGPNLVYHYFSYRQADDKELSWSQDNMRRSEGAWALIRTPTVYHTFPVSGPAIVASVRIVHCLMRLSKMYRLIQS